MARAAKQPAAYSEVRATRFTKFVVDITLTRQEAEAALTNAAKAKAEIELVQVPSDVIVSAVDVFLADHGDGPISRVEVRLSRDEMEELGP